MAKVAFTRGDEFGDWKLTKKISGGGNGSIWEVENKDGSTGVIKLLRKTHDTAKTRFIDEIKVMSENQDVPGVVKILDHSELELTTKHLWYAMPLGTTLNQELSKADSSSIVKAIIEVGNVLRILHDKGVSHRDIKPQNLLVIDDVVSIGDFGLVDYPLKEKGLTLKKNQLGPRWTIAPEMRNDPTEADGFKADVYSLAKSIWILITGVQTGFEGQYSPTGSIGLIHYKPSMLLSLIEELLVEATENDPSLRPTIDQFVERLENWAEAQADYAIKNAIDWTMVQQKLFPQGVPERVVWTNLDDIISVLNIVGGIPSLNHMMFPDNGGLDLDAVTHANEEGCIELDCGLRYIAKPTRLILESFDADDEWNYFRLEFDELKRFEKETEYLTEEVTEVAPGEYKKYMHYENYLHEHGSTPDNWRHVGRILGGSAVIFRKTSSYNSTPSTYDGRHSKVDADGFRGYIQQVIDSGYQVIRVQSERGKWVEKRYVGKILQL